MGQFKILVSRAVCANRVTTRENWKRQRNRPPEGVSIDSFDLAGLPIYTRMTKDPTDRVKNSRRRFVPGCNSHCDARVQLFDSRRLKNANRPGVASYGDARGAASSGIMGAPWDLGPAGRSIICVRFRVLNMYPLISRMMIPRRRKVRPNGRLTDDKAREMIGGS